MDAINQGEISAKRKRAGVRRPFKQQLRIDMTPMVDLGFLLISFFVITTELSKPTVMKLYMPKDGPSTDLGRSDALTVLMDKGKRAWFYEGDWNSAKAEGRIYAMNNVMELRRVIVEKQKRLDSTKKEGRTGLMLLVKPGSGTLYSALVDVLDEVSISDVKKYAVVKTSPEEKEWMNGQ